MPDWTAPFKVPKVLPETYAKQKAAYQAKNGFTITIPGLSDIFKIQTEEPMSALENYWYDHKEWDNFSPKRLDEIRKQKLKRKERYEAMLASPTPAIFQNAGSILTAVDDAQDAISTLACLGQIGRAVAPKLLGKLLEGPVGLLMVASDVLNLVQAFGMYCMAPMQGKRGAEQLQRGSPRTYRGQLKNRLNMKKKLPSKSDWIQGLQTTEQVFGFGISLGPLMGLVQDIVWGSVRTTFGDPPSVRVPIPFTDDWVIKGQRAAKSAAVLQGYEHETDDADILLWQASWLLSVQTLATAMKTWNPLEMVEDIANLEIKAPEPINILTKEVIAEGPVPYDSVIGWPQTSTQWANLMTIADATQPTATQNYANFEARNKHTWTGYVGGVTAQDSALYALAALEGYDDVAYDFNPSFKTAINMILEGYRLDPEQPFDKFELFAQYLEDCDEALYEPSMQDLENYCNLPWVDIHLQKAMF